MSRRYGRWAVIAILLSLICLLAAYPVTVIVLDAVTLVGISVSPDMAAEQLVHERGIPNSSAYNWGDELLPSLRSHSNDFSDLNVSSAFNVASVLAHNKSQAVTALGEELYYSQTGFYPKLVGAAIKASRKTLPAGEFMKDGFIGKILEKAVTNTYQADFPTALLAVKYAQAPESVPLLVTLLLRKPYNREEQEETAEAMEAVGDQHAAPALEKALRDPEVLARRAIFKALLAFSRKAAVSAAIENFPKKQTYRNRAPEYYYQDKLFIDDLEAVTDQHFGMNEVLWKQWLAAQN